MTTPPLDLTAGKSREGHAIMAGREPLLAQIDELKIENAEYEEIGDRMAKILRDTAAALKGDPDAKSMHSWHDLAEVATALKARTEAAELWTVAHPCDISHEAPYDFKWCEAHDRTFPLDGDCDHKGKSALEWQDAREQEQRIRAIRAEGALERMEQRAQGAEANLEAAIKVSLERLARAASAGDRAGAAEAKVKAVRELAARLLPVTERDPNIGQDTEEAHDEGHTEGWNEALTELARLLDGGA